MGSTSEAPLTVGVDATSTWVVADDCTISALNVAGGGKMADAERRRPPSSCWLGGRLAWRVWRVALP